SGLLVFFVLLNGASNSSILGDFYWIQADTSTISTAPHDITRWTNYRSCGVSNGRNYDCTGSSAAYPFSPQDNFNTRDGVPSSFINNRSVFYHLSKFAWAAFLIGLFFILLAIALTTLTLCCGTSFLTTASSGILFLALLFITAGASCMTAVLVKGRDAFRDSDLSVSISTKMMAFAWVPVFLLLVSFLMMFCLGFIAKSKKSKKTDRESGYRKNSYSSSDSD
ncbi:SUR7/PalI family protein, partial [Ascoidea rubescens DSM 1968]